MEVNKFYLIDGNNQIHLKLIWLLKMGWQQYDFDT